MKQSLVLCFFKSSCTAKDNTAFYCFCLPGICLILDILVWLILMSLLFFLAEICCMLNRTIMVMWFFRENWMTWWRPKVVIRSLVVVVVVVNPCSTKLPLATALKTFVRTVESRNSDLLLTLTWVLSYNLFFMFFIRATRYLIQVFNDILLFPLCSASANHPDIRKSV